MDDMQRLDDLRMLLMSAPESGSTRALAVGLSVALLFFVLWLVRKRKLREEYTPIWALTALGILVISVRIDLLQALTRAIGAWTPSSTIFFFADLFLMAICINYAVRLSRSSVQLKNLAQEVALLNARLDRNEMSAEARASES